MQLNQIYTKDMAKTRKGLRSTYSKRFHKNPLLSSGNFSKLYTVYLENRLMQDCPEVGDKPTFSDDEIEDLSVKYAKEHSCRTKDEYDMGLDFIAGFKAARELTDKIEKR